MPKFTVEAREKFVVRTLYQHVEAPSAEVAVELCRAGQVEYEGSDIEEGDEEWLETLSVEEE